MEAYMARVVCLTSVDTETPSEKQQRYERMTTLFDTKRVMLPPPPPRTSRHRVMVVLLRAWARRVLATRVVYTWWKRVQLQARIVKKYSGRRQQSILTPSSNNIKFQWYKEQDMPFPFSMFEPWARLRDNFLDSQTCAWRGKVDLSDFLYHLFYILNSNVGTQRVVTALIRDGVSLSDMQTGMVWLNAIVLPSNLQTLDVRVTRLKGSGMQPRVHIGGADRAILRVPITLCVKGAWSTPVWIDVGAMPFIDAYMNTINRGILDDAARRMTFAFRGLLYTHHHAPKISTLMPFLMPLLNGRKSPPPSSFQTFSDAVFMHRKNWKAWWNHWRRSTHRDAALTEQLAILRYVTCTSTGTNVLLRALLRASCEKLQLLFQGKRYLYIGTRPSPRNHELLVVTADASQKNIPPRCHDTTLGGGGPCCVPVCMEKNTFTWINVTTIPYAVKHSKWVINIYGFMFKQCVIVLRNVKKWIQRRKELKQ